MPAVAQAKGVRISPRRAGVVAALVRGRSVADALVILEHTPRRPADHIREVIKSAQANAEHNHNYQPNSLQITEISITPGPRLKRWRAAARGRALRYQHPTSHIKVVVDGQKRQIRKAAPPLKEEK